MDVRIALTTWYDPRAIRVRSVVHNPTPPQDARAEAVSGRSSRVGRLRAPATPKGRLRVATYGASSSDSGDCKEAAPREPGFRVACRLPMPKRQAQILDLKVLLHQEYGITYTDMVVQYRGVPVVDFEVLTSLPDWSLTPTLELLVLPGSHAQALELAERAASRDLAWAQLVAHVVHSSHHEDWIGHQASAEVALRRANGLLPPQTAGNGGVEDRLRAEHRMDTLLSEFGAAAASIVRVVGQYPCPLQPTESVELSERYGPGLKFVANGIVVRRLTAGLAISHSLEVCEAMRQAPKTAAANQRAASACRGRVPGLCVPLSVVVEFLGVRWEATAVAPIGELAFGTYTGGPAEPLRQLPEAAEVIRRLSKAFNIPARLSADGSNRSNAGVGDTSAAARRETLPRDGYDESSLLLPRSTRIFLGDDTPGMAGKEAESLWDCYLLAAPELLPPLPPRCRDRSGPITAWKTEVDTAVVAQDVGTTRPEFLFGPGASIPPENVVAPVQFDPRTAGGWTPPMPLRRCAKTHETITTFDFWVKREAPGGAPQPTVAMSESGLAKTMGSIVRDGSTDSVKLRDAMFERTSYLHDGAYCRLPCSCDGLAVETAARIHTQSAVQLLALQLERADPPLTVSGGHLSSTVHEYGVAIRQLGRVAERVNLRHVKETLLCEMVARAMREVCHNRLRRTEYNDVPFAKKVIVQTLNDLFSKLSPPTDSAVERTRELIGIMIRKFDVEVEANITERIHSALVLQRLCELNGLVLVNRPESYDLRKLNPFVVNDVAEIVPRVPTAGVGMRLATRKDPTSTAATEDGNKKKLDPLKTLCVAVAGGRTSWWMAKAMMRFAARLDALGQRSVWYLPGGPGRDWASERYSEGASLGMSIAHGDQHLMKQQRRANKNDKVVIVSSLSCQLVRACAVNCFERHCSLHGAPERSRWDHAAGTDLDAPFAKQAAQQWRWIFSIAATAVGYGVTSVLNDAAPAGATMLNRTVATGTPPASNLVGGQKVTVSSDTGRGAEQLAAAPVSSRHDMWGTVMRPDAMDPQVGTYIRRMDVVTMMAEQTARRISDSGLASRGLEPADGARYPAEMQVLDGLTVEQQQVLNMATLSLADSNAGGGGSTIGDDIIGGSDRPASSASYLSEPLSDSGSEATHLSKASFLSPQSHEAIDGTLTLGRPGRPKHARESTVDANTEGGNDDSGARVGWSATVASSGLGDNDDGTDDQEEDDEAFWLLGAGGGGYDMLALLMDAEVALASLDRPSLHARADQQLMHFFAAQRAVRSEVVARARLATLGLHNPQTASALLQLGLQLEEDLGELQPASRAIRRAFVGFRAALGRQDPRTIDALVSLRRLENRLLSGLEHVHDDDLTMVIEASETDSDADGQTALAGTFAPNLGQRLPTPEEATGDSLTSSLKYTDTLGYGAGAVSIRVRRKMLRIAVRSKNERALRSVSVDAKGLPT